MISKEKISNTLYDVLLGSMMSMVFLILNSLNFPSFLTLKNLNKQSVISFNDFFIVLSIIFILTIILWCMEKIHFNQIICILGILYLIFYNVIHLYPHWLNIIIVISIFSSLIYNIKRKSKNNLLSILELLLPYISIFLN